MSLGGTNSQLVELEGQMSDFFEDPGDFERTRKWGAKVVADLGPQKAWTNSERDGGRGNTGQSTAINNGMER